MTTSSRPYTVRRSFRRQSLPANDRRHREWDWDSTIVSLLNTFVNDLAYVVIAQERVKWVEATFLVCGCRLRESRRGDIIRSQEKRRHIETDLFPPRLLCLCGSIGSGASGIITPSRPAGRWRQRCDVFQVAEEILWLAGKPTGDNAASDVVNGHLRAG